ncbi:multicopper oxidase family protein [Phycicoccus sp. Root101]|uniref:multicopper oxidase family protein n=1 Tax=Phycicoccus sp. Root101 TaxID=1736421 RepID=UPI000703BBC4|nr:multicopper oxidase family protein [Phycicoccus sp. Root101]KQU67395.1 bilirubin oxidase [Phycicoccus sp. Root101]
MELSRKDLLKMSVLGAAAVALPLERSVGAATVLASRIAESRLPPPFTTPFSIPPVIQPVRSDATTDYYRVSMEPTTVEVIPGLQTQMWGYNGVVPGPTFQVAQGRRTVVRQINNLPSVHPVLNYTPWTSVHLHGSASLPEFDGYASDITNPGQYKDYQYPNYQPARTLWYHDHGVHHTAENVFMGLAGQYQLSDALDRSLPIPHGEFDVPLIVSDKMFNSDGSLLFSTNDNSGFYGDVILVNGRPWPVMKVKRRKYRFRILNASPSRSYNWSLDSGDSMAVIATDAGLMPTPQYVKSFRHGVAERYEVVIDFAKYQPGRRVVLRNTSPKNNINFTNTNKIMAFEVVDDSFSEADNSVPSSLNPNQATMLLKESDAVQTRTMNFVRANGQWTINGTTWEDVVRSRFMKVLANPRIDDVEIWELRNPSGGWHHPAHIHFIDFRILSRNGRPPLPHELGAKDVVFLGENESVRLLIKFDGGRGKYMIHCHNLVHEDHDMMSQFEIRDDVTPAHDPLSNLAKWLPEGDL